MAPTMALEEITLLHVSVLTKTIHIKPKRFFRFSWKYGALTLGNTTLCCQPIYVYIYIYIVIVNEYLIL